MSNASFDDPVISAGHGASIARERASGFFAQYVARASPWSALLTLFLAAIVYDQGGFGARSPQASSDASLVKSKIYLQQGLHRRSLMEDPLHWTLSTIRESEIRRVSCEMDEWPSKLRLRLPQVRHPHHIRLIHPPIRVNAEK